MTWSWILRDRLAQGSAPIGPQPFDLVVLCAEEWQPPGITLGGSRVLRAPLSDCDPIRPGDVDAARRAAEVVARNLRAGRSVLVTCMLGRNRSGLVSALSLARYTGRQTSLCGRVVRLRRAGALSNRAFARYLGC